MAVVAAWLGLELRRATNQERAVTRIRQAGGVNVFYDYEDGEAFAPEWLRRILGNGLGARVNRIDVHGLGLTDRDMDDLSSLADVRELWLWDNPVSDDGIARLHLKSFTRLVSLNLAHTRVTDNGLIYLREIPNLNYLYLFNTAITDVGLANVAHFPKLIELDLENTLITDAGLVELRVLRNLRELNLYNTRVTDAGGTELQRARPKCNVYWGKI